MSTAPAFNPKAPHGICIGDSAAAFHQHNLHYDREHRAMSAADLKLDRAEYYDNHEAAAPTPTPTAAAVVMTTAPVVPEPEVPEISVAEELGAMHATKIKQLVIDAGLEPETGKGAKGKNIAQLIAFDKG
jgi:hypothetical protein